MRLQVSNLGGSYQALINDTEKWILINNHSVFRTKMEFLVVFDCLWFQREPCLLSAVCEDLEAALLGGRVVAAGSGQDGPFPLVLQLPDVGDVGGPHLPGGGQRGRGRGGRGPCSCTSRRMIGNIERTESWSQVCYTWRQSRIVQWIEIVCFMSIT